MATSAPEKEAAPGFYGDAAENAEHVERSSSSTEKPPRADGKWELEETDAWEVTGYSFPTW